ncbi:hypothetical protein N7517_003314 [Penicillium concentricum]|uniref:Uncharacterized protein n=1 Tax=Penicillium concentricum TaxID=293559 RepID=A0A9W9VKB7_9EURO|nr:uncharacterized protein N7517_003314 [Penicillium concentricum]KAJ5385403.1 hypothetical protein N7517_003314 [Penicillium concentricum]
MSALGDLVTETHAVLLDNYVFLRFLVGAERLREPVVRTTIGINSELWNERIRGISHLDISQTVTRIWSYCTNWPSGGPQREPDDIYHGVPFIKVAEGYIDNSLDICDDDDARWFHCMDLYGISSELQQAIMDPKFRHIRLTKSRKFWAQNTSKLRYRGLQAV